MPSGVDGAAVAGDAFGVTVLGGMSRAIRERFARGVVTIEAAIGDCDVRCAIR